MTGGYRDSNRSDNTNLIFTGCDITIIMVLGMIIVTHNYHVMHYYTNENCEFNNNIIFIINSV